MNIGLDAIEMTVSGKNLKYISDREPTRENEQGNIYLRVRNGKERDSYIITIIPSAMLRENNLVPFSLSDVATAKSIVNRLENDLSNIFGLLDINTLFVNKVEINANKEVREGSNVNTIIEFLAMVCLSTRKGDSLMAYYHGARVKGCKKYCKKIANGFKTQRDSTKRFCAKIYRKDTELGLEDKIPPTLRIELVYNKLGLQHIFRKKEIEFIRINDILNSNNLQSLLYQFSQDISEWLCRESKDWLIEVRDIICKDLERKNLKGKREYTLYETFQRNYRNLNEIICYDFTIFRKAVQRYYVRCLGKTKKEANTRICEVKNRAIEEGYSISETNLKDLAELFREIKSISIIE